MILSPGFVKLQKPFQSSGKVDSSLPRAPSLLMRMREYLCESATHAHSTPGRRRVSKAVGSDEQIALRL